MVDLLVSVKVGGLDEHLLRLTSHLILLMHFDACLQTFVVGLLGAHFALSDRLLLRFIFLLEIALCLQVEIIALSTKAIVFRDEARRVGSGLVVKESVGVGRLSSESCRWHKF